MKITFSSVCVALIATTCVNAFSVAPATTRPSSKLFANPLDDMTLEEEVENMLKTEKEKASKLGKISSETGQTQFAPWMGQFGDEEEQKLRSILKEKAVARRKQRSSIRDSTVQELSGSGLRGTVVDGDSVELEWSTSSETNTNGYIVKRRPAKTEDFAVLASYQNYGPLASKGVDGGVYRFLDDSVGPGGWVYRVSEVEKNGSENDLSQCLVEIQTAEEKAGQLIALAGLAVVAVAAVAAGVLLDPMQ